MEILKKEIELCERCNNYSGFVKEKYNGYVPVYCACELRKQRDKYGAWRSPCMISLNGDKLWWTPISDHKKSDGKWWHTPWFGGPGLNCKKAENMG